MSTPASLAQENAQDIFFGQIVLIWSRWFFVAAGTVLALWSARTLAELTAVILVVIGLMAMNFFVHGRYLLEKPVNRFLLAGLSLLDLALITVFVWNWQGQGGLQSELFVFYYPLVFAFALVFAPAATLGYTGLVLGAYLGVCLLARPGLLTSAGLSDYVTLLTRLITLAAMGGLGTYYWRIQRTQRRALAAGLAHRAQAGAPQMD